MPDENQPFKIPADDVERANIGTVNPDCPQCSVWGFECKLPKCGPQVNVWDCEEISGHELSTYEGRKAAAQSAYCEKHELIQPCTKCLFPEKLDDLLPPHLRMDRKPVISMLTEEPRAFKLDEKGTIVPNPEYEEWQKSEKHKYVARAMYEDRPATQADFKREVSPLTGEEIFHKPVTSLNYCARASLAKQPWKCGTCQREIFNKESHIKGCVGREIYTDDGKAIINWYSGGTWPVNSKTYPVRVEKSKPCHYGLGEENPCMLKDGHEGAHLTNPDIGEAMLPWKVIPFITIVVIVLMGIFYRG